MTGNLASSLVAQDGFGAFVAGLKAQYGAPGIIDLAVYYLEAEAADFHWDARQNERHLGEFGGAEDLERIAIIGWLNGRWFVAVCLVDGEGMVDDIAGIRRFDSVWDAEGAFETLQ